MFLKADVLMPDADGNLTAIRGDAKVANAAHEIASLLRNRPTDFFKKYTLPIGRNSGKTLIQHAVLAYALDAVNGHVRRLRGRYIHSHKGRTQRRHRLRVSPLDN